MEATTSAITLLRDTDPTEVIEHIMTRIKEGRTRVAILAPTNKDAKVLFKEFKEKMDEKPVTQYSFSAEYENGSKVVAASIASSSMIGQAFDLIYLDSLAQVDYDIADEFWNSMYPTICHGQTKVIITHGKDYFETLWNSHEIHK